MEAARSTLHWLDIVKALVPMPTAGECTAARGGVPNGASVPLTSCPGDACQGILQVRVESVGDTMMKGLWVAYEGSRQPCIDC